MRVLFCDHPEGDFLSAMLFKGLCEELGESNVVDWPWKASFHGETDRYPSVYEGGGEGITGPFAFMPAFTAGRRWSEDEVADGIAGFDLVILASTRAYNDAALTRLLARVGRAAVRRLVVVDTEDHDAIASDHVRRFQPSVYFKRELLVTSPREVGGVPIEPLGFAAPMPVLPSTTPPGRTPKDIDVVFLGGDNFPGGKPPLEAAVRRVTSNVVAGRLGYQQYLDTLARARCLIMTRGYGWDCLRFWEFVASEGTLLVADRQPLVRSHPYVDGQHVALFGSPDELEGQLRRYLHDEPRRARVAAAGYAWTLAHHTCRARAAWMLARALAESDEAPRPSSPTTSER
jgi:hypothetical protein